MPPVSLLATVTLALLLVAAPLAADENEDAPAYAAQSDDLVYLDNGVVVEGRDIETADGYTSGFRVTAGFSPLRLLDLGAELSYRESDEVPTQLGGRQLLLDTVSLGGSLLAGVRLGPLGLYAKSGVAGWEGNPVIPRDALALTDGGTTKVQGLGARLQFARLVSRLEYEEFNAPDMAHLNLITASLHLPF